MREETLIKNFQNMFGRNPEALQSACGRVEFIGNHVDYNGGVVLGLAINKHISVALAKRDDAILHFASLHGNQSKKIDLNKIEKQEYKFNWVNYPLGMVKVLKEAGHCIDKGFDFLDISDLPSGVGLSSSAAVELAMGKALCELYNIKLTTIELVKLAKKCENEFVGMPCGILDQGVCGFGKESSVVFIDCLEEKFSLLDFPNDWNLWVVNSGVKHALTDGLYAQRRQDCMDAAKILSGGGEFKLLSNFSIKDLEAKKDLMDERIYKRAKHVIEEISRVYKCIESIKNKDIVTTGKLLSASHESSRTLFENSCPELDSIVSNALTQKGIHGARLSGGGFGGSAILLADKTFMPTANMLRIL